MEMLVYILQITEVITLSATCGETTFFVFYQVSCPPPPTTPSSPQWASFGLRQLLAKPKQTASEWGVTGFYREF
jgi:hypothetical protein